MVYDAREVATTCLRGGYILNRIQLHLIRQAFAVGETPLDHAILMKGFDQLVSLDEDLTRLGISALGSYVCSGSYGEIVPNPFRGQREESDSLLGRRLLEG